jgi:hypothetical protein
MADNGLIIAASHHIIAVTLVLSIYTLQAEEPVIHEPNEKNRKNKLCIIATTPLLAVVQTASYKNG